MDAEAWDARYASAELVWGAGPNRFVAEEAEGLTPGRALDLACGEGRNAIWLATLGWSATGVDFSRAGLDKARALAGQRGVEVEWVRADVTAYEPEPRAFDLVVVAYLQVPASEMAAALRHAVEALAPGGTLLVVGHADTNIAEGYGGPQDPAVLYGPDEVVAALGDLTVERLSVEKAERVRRPVETDAGTVDAIDTLVRAHRAD